jgi:hypothetical protein
MTAGIILIQLHPRPAAAAASRSLWPACNATAILAIERLTLASTAAAFEEMLDASELAQLVANIGYPHAVTR